MRKGFGEYPGGWPEYARQLKEQAGWKCIRCNHPHDPASGHTLTVHHATMNKAEPFDHWWAFWVLCQKCHLTIQSRVILERPWLFEHSDWAKLLIGGWSAWFYLGVELTREQVEADLDYYAGLQRAMLVEVGG